MLDDFCVLAERCHLSDRWQPLLPDPDDEAFAHLASEAKADHLVTHNQRHYEPIRQRGIRVVTRRRFSIPFGLEHENDSSQRPGLPGRPATEAAAKEQTTLDNIVTVALAAHIGAWQVRDDIETRAKRGNLEMLDKILARVPARPPLPGDEL